MNRRDRVQHCTKQWYGVVAGLQYGTALVAVVGEGIVECAVDDLTVVRPAPTPADAINDDEPWYMWPECWDPPGPPPLHPPQADGAT